MPASYFTDMEKTNGIGDERALQLALELTMLGLEPLGGVTEPDPTADLTAFVNPLSNPMDEVRSKKSQNMTECVPVPSSEHVAEIVGRQGEFIFVIIQLSAWLCEKHRNKNFVLWLEIETK